MSETISSVVLPGRVQQLLDERSKHIGAISHIDQILDKIGSALGTTGARLKAGRPPKAAKIAAPPKGKKRGRRRGRKFGMSGEETILAFIKQNKNPTTQEINKHWKSQGRGGTADNSLSKLTREKHLKREPLVGVRGSKYMIA